MTGRFPERHFERLEEVGSARRSSSSTRSGVSAVYSLSVAKEKLAVVPLAYDAPAAPRPRETISTEKTVLWLGQVILRKGIQYLLLQPGCFRRIANPCGSSLPGILDELRCSLLMHDQDPS